MRYPYHTLPMIDRLFYDLLEIGLGGSNRDAAKAGAANEAAETR
jgi:hypothetical protein